MIDSEMSPRRNSSGESVPASLLYLKNMRLMCTLSASQYFSFFTSRRELWGSYSVIR